MSRRRWLSTDISKDARIRKLAADAGEFAALVYTWAIPHAADDGSLPADPDELLMLVTPGFRWRTTEDMQSALDAMLELGLLEQHADRLTFPASFYKYQTYVTADRREPGAHGWGPHNEQQRKPAHNTAEPRDSTRITEEPRETPLSSYLTSSSSLSLGSGASALNARARAREIDSSRLCAACSKRLPQRRPAHGLCADCHGKALMAAKDADVDVTHISLGDLVEFAIRAQQA